MKNALFLLLFFSVLFCNAQKAEQDTVHVPKNSIYLELVGDCLFYTATDLMTINQTGRMTPTNFDLWTDKTAGNMGLLQAGLTQELQPLSLSITFGAWRQVSASKPRLQQALKRQTV